MLWSYGITTIAERHESYFQRTLESLKKAGFDKPRLFVDGEKDGSKYASYGLETTTRHPRLKAYGNWILALGELFIRHPAARFYAIFQDDFVTMRNLRGYLEGITYHPRGYWNLYTFPENQKMAPNPEQVGWFESNQKGLGAVGLVFNREAVIMLLRHPHMIDRPMDPIRGKKFIDGGVVESMRKAGWKELVHNPSLVQHIGTKSSLSNGVHPTAVSFPGEEFDAMELLGRPKLVIPKNWKHATEPLSSPAYTNRAHLRQQVINSSNRVRLFMVQQKLSATEFEYVRLYVNRFGEHPANHNTAVTPQLQEIIEGAMVKEWVQNEVIYQESRR